MGGWVIAFFDFGWWVFSRVCLFSSPSSSSSSSSSFLGNGDKGDDIAHLHLHPNLPTSSLHTIRLGLSEPSHTIYRITPYVQFEIPENRHTHNGNTLTPCLWQDQARTPPRRSAA